MGHGTIREFPEGEMTGEGEPHRAQIWESTANGFNQWLEAERAREVARKKLIARIKQPWE